MQERPSLSLVIPIYNEAEHIEANIRTITDYLDDRGGSYEVILADDGSTDGTKEILRRVVAEKRRPLRLVENAANRGKGSVLTLGLTAGAGDVRGFLDADLEIEVRFVGDLLDRLDGTDICVGSRALDGANAERSTLRHLAHHGYNTIVRLFLGTSIQDNSSGIKFFRREVCERIVPAVRDTGWGWDVEFLVRAQREGFRVREVAIRTVERRISKVRVFRTALQTMGMVLGLFLRGVRVRRHQLRLPD